MKKLLTIAVVLFCLPNFAQAQFSWGKNYFEVGVGGGVMSYSGELTNSFFDVKHWHPGGALFVRYNVGKFLSVRGQLAFGYISGNDADSKDLANRIRNLSFRSHLFEGSLIVEANLMGYQPRGHEKMFSPYAFLGISVFNFNPQTRHFDPNQDGAWTNLGQYTTEGQGSSTFSQRKPYSKTQVSIPMGLGVKFAVNSHINIGFEVGIRPTFTDYLDDVGQTYPVDALTQDPLYDATPYRPGEFGDRSAQELFADRSYEFIYNELQNNTTQDLAHLQGMTLNEYLNYITPILRNYHASSTLPADTQEKAALEHYNSYVNARGGSVQRGDKMNDWYMFTMITVSYNFIDNGLVGFRKRRKRRAGCKSAQF